MARPRTDVDWAQVQSEYIAGTMSLQKLAAKYKVGYKAIAERSSAGGWKRQRDKYRRDTCARAVKQLGDKHVRKIARELEGLAFVSEKLSGTMQRAMEDSDQFNRHLVQEKSIRKDGGADVLTVERVYDKLDARALRDFTAALADLTKTMRNLFELPTDAEREQRQMARERLDMDRRKAEDAAGAGEIRVVIEPRAQEYAV